jgi:formylglycine-generating enzyme required for sulfatase activity
LVPQYARAQSSDRVALIIGNSSYPDANTPLATTLRDARTLADEFRRVDFQVDLKENVGKEDMKRAIDAFTAKIKNGTEALFYFSGFGLQADRRSYIIPVDAQIWSEADVRRDGTSVDDVLAEMQRRGAKVKIVIIDASRRNPFERRFRTSPAGLAPLGAPEGTLALFSAAPGVVVYDRESGAQNSVLVSELIKELRSPNQTAEQAFNRTRIGVSRASNNEVVPWVASSLLEEFYFRARQVAVQPNPPPQQQQPLPQQQQPAPPPPPPPPQQQQQPRQQQSAPPPPPPPPVADNTPVPAPDPKPRVAPVTGRFTPGQVFRDCDNCPEMVVVPAGSFMMGGRTDYATPAHSVTIPKQFAIGRYEVTFAEWDACLAERACKARPSDRGWGRNRNPVMNVSWLDAKEFAAWLSQKTGQRYRLPSESEWEYASRANTRGTYWWGADVGARHANCNGCGTGQAQKTLQVGSFPPNAFGLYDTSGNVAEWVEDCWHADYQGAPSDGSAWTTGQCQLRVLRGGAFDSSANYITTASRFRYDYDVAYSANGFRLVRELP